MSTAPRKRTAKPAQAATEQPDAAEAPEAVEPEAVEPEATEPQEVAIDAQTFADNAHVEIQVAGLLADKPDLRGAHLTRADWQQHLATYLNSPRS